MSIPFDRPVARPVALLHRRSTGHCVRVVRQRGNVSREGGRERERERGRREEGEEEEEEEEEESLFKADAVNEEDPERDRATQV